MIDCQTCQTIQSASLTLFEDESVVALVSPEPVSAGHIIVVPKKHHPILEAVPDAVMRRIAVVATKLSTAAFEALGAQGTNLLIQNGLPAGQSKPHVQVSIIPRRDGDNLQLEWKPGQVSEDESGKAEVYLKEASGSIGVFEKEAPKPLEEKTADTPEISESDYRVRQLRRIP